MSAAVVGLLALRSSCLLGSTPAMEDLYDAGYRALTTAEQAEFWDAVEVDWSRAIRALDALKAVSS